MRNILAASSASRLAPVQARQAGKFVSSNSKGFRRGFRVEVIDNGEIHPVDNNNEGKNLIEAIGLDDEDYNELRRAVFELRDILPIGSKPHSRWFGYPKDLPDLSKEPVPPLGNKRPNGVQDSYYGRLRREELPAYF